MRSPVPSPRAPRSLVWVVAWASVVALLGACEGEFVNCVPDGGESDGGDPDGGVPTCASDPAGPDLVLCRAKCAHVAECTQSTVAPTCADDCVTIIQTADILGDPDQRPLFQCEATTPCDQLPTCTVP